MTSSPSSALKARRGTLGLNDADRAVIATITASVSVKVSLKKIESLSDEQCAALVNLIQGRLDSIRRESLPPSVQLGERTVLRRRAMRLLVKLSVHYNIFPDGLFVSGVTCKQTLDPLVRGGFADIFEGELNGLKVAMKRLRTYGNAAERDKIHDMVRREATMWRQLDHPNVLPLLGIDRATFSPLYAIISPWMPNGSLVDYIEGHKVSGPAIHQLLREVAEGLQYLHDQDIIHGDLRGANVLVNDAKQACLADFGLARVSSTTTTVTSTVPHSNARWLAPELLDGEVEAPNTRSDVFALGRVCLEAYTQKVPFWYIPHEPGVITKLLRGEDVTRPKIHECAGRKLSDKFWHLLQETWAKDPLVRPTAAAFIEKLDATLELHKPRILIQPMSTRGDSGSSSIANTPKGTEATKPSMTASIPKGPTTSLGVSTTKHSGSPTLGRFPSSPPVVVGTAGSGAQDILSDPDDLTNEERFVPQLGTGLAGVKRVLPAFAEIVKLASSTSPSHRFQHEREGDSTAQSRTPLNISSVKPTSDGISIPRTSQTNTGQISQAGRQTSWRPRERVRSISDGALASISRITTPSTSLFNEITTKWKSTLKSGRSGGVGQSSAQSALKILFLGPSGGGKSTLLQHMKLHFAPSEFNAELHAWRAVIELTLVRAVNALVTLTSSSNGIGADLTDSAMQSRALRLATLRQVEEVLCLRLHGTKTSRDPPDEMRVQGGIGGKRWKALTRNWASKGGAEHDKELTEARQRLNAYVNDIVKLCQGSDLRVLSEPEKLYVSRARRICKIDYVPTHDDILRSRVWTQRFEEHRFTVDLGDERKRDIAVYDVNGQFGLPADWGPYFDQVSMVFFVVPMADFDRTVAGSNTKQCLDDAVLKWQELCGDPHCAGKIFVVLLNQMDLLAAKLNKGVRFAAHVPAYGDGPNEYKSVVKYIHRLFAEVGKSNSVIHKDQIFFHPSSAINVGLMSNLFQSVRNFIAPGQENFQDT